MAMEVTATSGDKIRCDACPVMCYIKPGAAGACDRYANQDGQLVRVDPHVVLERTVEHGGRLVPFQAGGDWDGKIVYQPDIFVTAIGAGTTYPDYKPAPFIVSSQIEGVDMVTVVTEGIFSYCGAKAKIDTDRYVGPEQAAVRARGEQVGHVTTAEYGSQMLALGGVRHQGARPAVDTRTLFPGGTAGLGLGRHQYRQSPRHHPEDRSRRRLAGAEVVDGIDDRRPFDVARAR